MSRFYEIFFKRQAARGGCLVEKTSRLVVWRWLRAPSCTQCRNCRDCPTARNMRPSSFKDGRIVQRHVRENKNGRQRHMSLKPSPLLVDPLRRHARRKKHATFPKITSCGEIFRFSRILFTSFSARSVAGWVVQRNSTLDSLMLWLSKPSPAKPEHFSFRSYLGMEHRDQARMMMSSCSLSFLAYMDVG